MLSRPRKNVVWTRSDHLAELSFFRLLMTRRRRPERVVRRPKAMAAGDARWKPSAWTPWLWVK
jgi:hypothetical protein